MRTRPLILAPRLLVVAASVAALGGCGDKSYGVDPELDPVPPVLTIEGPARGTILDGTGSVVVSGQVTDADSGIDRVTVDDIDVPVDDAGRFSLTLPAGPGLSLIHTTARDLAGNLADDTRAVLAGDFVPGDGVVQGALSAWINESALRVLGHAVARGLAAADLGVAIQPLNPVIGKTDGGCLSGKVWVLDVDLRTAALEITTGPGRLGLEGLVLGLDVPVRVDYTFSCIAGSLTGRIRVGTVSIAGGVELAAADHRLAATLIDPAIELDDLQLDVDGLPEAVVDLIFGAISGWVGGMIADSIEAQLGPRLEQALAGAAPHATIDVLGHGVQLEALPSSITIDDGGALVELDGRAVVEGGTDGPGYIASQAPRPALPGGSVAGAVADDLGNQLLATAWSAGALDFELPVSGDELGLSGVIDTLRVTAALPPMVATSALGETRVALGDVIVEAVGDGQVVTRAAINLELDLSVDSTDSGVRLVVGEPRVAVDVASDGVVGPNPLDDDELERVVSHAVTRAAGALGTLLGELPLPTVYGVSLVNLAIGGSPGYLTFGAAIVE